MATETMGWPNEWYDALKRHDLACWIDDNTEIGEDPTHMHDAIIYFIGPITSSSFVDALCILGGK